MNEHNTRGGGVSRSRDIEIYMSNFDENDDIYLKGFKVLDLLTTGIGNQLLQPLHTLIIKSFFTGNIHLSKETIDDIIGALIAHSYNEAVCYLGCHVLEELAISCGKTSSNNSFQLTI